MTKVTNRILSLRTSISCCRTLSYKGKVFTGWTTSYLETTNVYLPRQSFDRNPSYEGKQRPFIRHTGELLSLSRERGDESIREPN